MEQQQKSDLIPKVIGVPEIKVNLLPTTSKSTSSFLNKLLPHDSQKDDASSAFKHLSFLSSLQPIDNLIFKHEEHTNDIPNAEMIEIEVPLIGKEFTRKIRDKAHFEEESEGLDDEIENEFVEINLMPIMSQVGILETTQAQPSSFPTEKQQSSSRETNTKSFHQTSSSPHSTTNDISYYSPLAYTENLDDIHAIESKLMDQYHSSHTSEEVTEQNLIRKLKFKKEEVTTEQPNLTTQRQYNHKYPFSVKVIVNNEDEKASCKNKQSCSQVSFAKKHDIDQEFYKDEMNDDLFFNSDEKPNQLKARRAADGGFFNTFNGLSLTPAPRFSGLNSNHLRGMPNIPAMSVPKKPTFIERLENESSLERSERVNKDLNNLMKLVAVWAHVDKFVSDRARSTIKRLAFMTDEDYVDNFVLGSRKKVDNNLNTIAKNADEPFT